LTNEIDLGGRRKLEDEIQKRADVKNWVISKLQIKPLKWSELMKFAEQEKSLKINSKYLTNILHSLEENGIIKQEKISHKNRPYSLNKKFGISREEFLKGMPEPKSQQQYLKFLYDYRALIRKYKKTIPQLESVIKYVSF